MAVPRAPISVRPSEAKRPLPADYKMLATELPTQRPASGTADATGRASFSSVRENDDGVAQTFTKTKVSSFAQVFDEAADEAADVEMGDVVFLPPITQPHSRLHGNWLPSSSFKGWKQINVQGRAKTRSYGDLQVLNMMWHPPLAPPRVEPQKPAPGSSAIEKLPMELLGRFSPCSPSPRRVIMWKLH